ncbi:MAG: hypothetical protein ACRCZI_02335, partial [Cetobacterium sp.]
MATVDPSTYLRHLKSLISDYNNIGSFQPGATVDNAASMADINYNYNDAVNQQFGANAQLDSEGTLALDRSNIDTQSAVNMLRQMLSERLQSNTNSFADRGTIRSGSFLKTQGDTSQNFINSVND